MFSESQGFIRNTAISEKTQPIFKAAFVCNQLDNTLRRDYQIKCKKWKNAWGDKPECCDACQADFKTCYDECKDQIELSPPGTQAMTFLYFFILTDSRCSLE